MDTFLKVTKLIVLIIICGCVDRAEAALEFGSSVSGTILETAPDRTEIACLSCYHSSPPDRPRNITMARVSTSPTFLCNNCFNVYRASDLGFPKSDWCVYYLTSGSNLDYDRMPQYTLTVSCTDGANTIFSDVLITVVPNQPPRIITPPRDCPSPIIASGTNAGASVYTYPLTNVNDPEGDKLSCSMTTDPVSDSFRIIPATCEILATRDLTAECNPSITFNIFVHDNITDPVGPLAATCDIQDTATPPNIPNLNTTVGVREDLAVGSVAYTFDSNLDVTYTILDVMPDIAYGLFDIRGRNLRLREKLNYEDPTIQNVRIELAADNGKCAPVFHFLNIRTIEVNEAPVLTPELYRTQVNEGRIEVNPLYECDDEDRGDRCTFSILSDTTEGHFQINKDTGIITASAFDLDLNSDVTDVNHTLEILVVDERGLNDTAIVHLNIRDINDNSPIIVDPGIAFTITDCDAVGLLPEKFEATDDDSSYRGNNVISFVPFISSCLQILDNGEIHLLNVPAVSETGERPPCRGTTRAVDQGEFPGPRTSTTDATVSVAFDCQPTPSPAPDDGDGNGDGNGDTATSATTVAVVVNNTLSANVAGADLGLIFGILGGILGALLLASLLAYCCRRWCGKKKTAPFSSEKTATKKKKNFDSVKKQKKAQAATGAAAAPGASVVAPTMVQRFLRVRRKIPFLRVKRRVPIQTVQRLVPLGPTIPSTTIRTAPGPVRTVLPAPPPYRMSGSAPAPFRQVW